MFRYLPEQASSHAADVDWIHHVITDISVFFTVAIVGAMLYFAYKYRKRDGVDHETPRIEGSHELEALWTIVPTIIIIFVAYYGIIYYHDIRTVPENAMTVNVTGQKWSWTFDYENGKQTFNEFVLPVDKPVKLLMTSKDVLHSFFIPAMRVKSDVVPGQYTYISFTPVKTGTYRNYCTEYCGTNHWSMLSSLKVVSQAEFDAWLKDNSEELKAKRVDPKEYGAELYVQRGCNACHSLDGSKIVGPTFKQIFGQERKFTDGTSAVVDEEYLRKSIYNPNEKIVEGYAPAMPSFEGQIDETGLRALIAFIKSIDGTQKVEVFEDEPVEEEAELSKLSPVERGEKYYVSKTCNTCHSLDGSRLVGPSFKGLYGKTGELVDGAQYKADDAYITESIKEPNKKVVKDYPPAMPMIALTDEEISDLIAYMKTIK